MEFDFVQIYGRSPWQEMDRRFLWILLASLFFTFANIALLRILDFSYSKEDIFKRYNEQLAQLHSKLREVRFFDLNEKPEDVIVETITTPFAAIPRAKPKPVSPESGAEALLKVLTAPADSYDDLPDLTVETDLAIDNFIAEKNRIARDGLISRRSGMAAVTESKEVFIDETFNPWEYDLERKGELYLESTGAMINVKGQSRGWRDPDEITLMIQNREAAIEYCYKKERMLNGVRPGYVLVRFKISYQGHVESGSVKILKSSIFNKHVENCIKKSIRRWRGFEKLSQEMGTVTVIQKFIFN